MARHSFRVPGRYGLTLTALGTLGVAFGHAGCGSSNGPPEGTFPTDGDAATDGTSPTDDGPSLFEGSTGGDATSCTKNLCGSTCCTGSTVCVFDRCVTPGKACHTANDCTAGQYCEPSLGQTGTVDAGFGTLDGSACTQPIPLAGRCLDLPPSCGDAGTPAPGCIATCEYHPPGGGPLNAVPRWTWGPVATKFPDFTDVWSTPTVGRVYDSNCDRRVDELDPPNVIFVSGSAHDPMTGKGTCCQCNGSTPTACHKGVLRMLDGRSGEEIWSLDKASPGSAGWAGLSTAIADIDNDGRLDVLAVSGEGLVVMLDASGNVVRTSTQPIPGNASATFGWGGGLAVADMDGDGAPEIAYGSTVFTTTGGAITLKFSGAKGTGASSATADTPLSTFVDLDGAVDGHLELLAGNTAYKADGTILWNRADLTDGFPAVGDFNKDGTPEAVLVTTGKLYILNGATGATIMGPAALPGTGSGGPPTVADFDADGKPEIGVAMATFYSVMKPNFTSSVIDVLWSMPNHDLSSSVTGSTVFDFEGDGKAEAIYADECFLWVFDGKTGKVRFASPHTSFTATEASLLADIDGDGRAEMLMVSNGADPSAGGSWPCDEAPWNTVTADHPAWVRPPGKPSYRGLQLFGDKANSWVGTRTLWTQHTYHVSNVCDARDTACVAPSVYGSVPKRETKNWTLPWLNNFRQNVQDKGVFDAPDATLALAVDCSAPVIAHASVRNIGQASLPAGADVGIFVKKASGDAQVATSQTTRVLFPGQVEQLDVTVPAAMGTSGDAYYGKIVVDPMNPKFHECRDDNDTSNTVTPACTR